MSEPVHADTVARKDFSLSFRGFDQHEVRAYLGQLAGEITGWRERVEQLQARIAELEAVPQPELDDVALEAALGREATRVIHAAREAAADIRARAESESAVKMAEAEELLANGTAEAEAAAAAIRAEVEEALVALREDTERRATAIIDESRANAASMLADATRERDQVLEELAARRSSLVADVERLREARGRLVASFDVVRVALDAAMAEVGDADASASALLVPPPVEEPAPAAVEPEPDPGPESEPDPEPSPEPERDLRRSTSLKLVRGDEGRGTPLAPPLLEPYEGVRVIRPEPQPGAEPAPEPQPDAAPEPVEVGIAEAAPADEGTADDGAVDGLFARLRADRAGKVASAEAVLAAAEHGDDVEPEPPAGETPTGETPAALEPDLALLAARDETVAGDERTLVRSLKRALADEQNEVLDGLRRLRGAPTLDALLPERAVHDARFDAVLGGGVAAAAAAGGAAAGGKGGRAAPVSAELGRSITADLRARIERAIEEATGDVETLAEAISSAYREWKTARAEPLARDAIAAGFAAGMYSASSGTLRWVVDPAEGGCPDCDDNALAGATAKGSAFPTGQLYPPAHAGCRCVVVTVT